MNIPVTLGVRPRSVVRIWREDDDRPIGVGFLVDRSHVMTCAHVVGDALSTAVESGTAAPDRSVKIDFPSLAPKQWYTGRPIPAKWDPQQDIAVLMLDDAPALPLDARPVRACATTRPGDPITAYGVTEDIPDGTWVIGQIADTTIKGRAVFNAAHEDMATREGCSGGAAWNVSRGGISGMIVERQGLMQGRIIPVSDLESVWPIAPQSSPELYSLPQEVLSSLKLGDRLSTSLYRFDRELQESDFEDALKELWEDAQAPIICVIAGLADDRPILCRDRCIQVKLSELLERIEIGKAPTPIKIYWPDRALLDVDSELFRLQRQVRNALKSGPSAGEIAKKFNDHPEPVVFFCSIKRSKFDSSHGSLLSKWIEFWRGIGVERTNKPLAVFLIFELDGASPEDFCLERYFTDELRKRPPGGVKALEQLNDFSPDDVVDWLNQKAAELGISDTELGLVVPEVRRSLSSGMSLRLAHLENWMLRLNI